MLFLFHCIQNTFFAFLRVLDIPIEARKLSEQQNFELKAFGIDAKEEQTRGKRLVRIGAIQNQIVLPTTEPVIKQVITALNSGSYIQITVKLC